MSLFALFKQMVNLNEISKLWLNKVYHVAVIAVFAFLLIFGPFSQTIFTARMAGNQCCTPFVCCCKPLAEHISTEISKKCGCEVSEIPDIPILPLGISHQSTSRIDTPSGTIDFEPLYIVKQLTESKSKISDYSISLKAPPLYLKNSSFLI